MKRKKTMLNTFEILQEYLALDALMNEINEETGEFINSEDDIREYIDKLNGSRDEKLVNIEKLKREFTGQVNTIDLEIKRLQNLKKQRSNNIDKLIDLQMMLTRGEKIDAGLFKFSTRKSVSVSVPDIVDPSVTNFVRAKYEWDKTAIKKELDRGVDYSEYGISLVEKVSLTVK